MRQEAPLPHSCIPGKTIHSCPVLQQLWRSEGLPAPSETDAMLSNRAMV